MSHTNKKRNKDRDSTFIDNLKNIDKFPSNWLNINVEWLSIFINNVTVWLKTLKRQPITMFYKTNESNNDISSLHTIFRIHACK